MVATARLSSVVALPQSWECSVCLSTLKKPGVSGVSWIEFQRHTKHHHANTIILLSPANSGGGADHIAFWLLHFIWYGGYLGFAICWPVSLTTTNWTVVLDTRKWCGNRSLFRPKQNKLPAPRHEAFKPKYVFLPSKPGLRASSSGCHISSNPTLFQCRVVA